MMLICSAPYRFWSIKSRRRSSFFIQFCIVFFICIFLFDRIILQSHYFIRKNVIVQTDLLDYNEDKLRSDWPFQIDKHYDVNDLQTYYPKPKIIAKADLPGERGDELWSHFTISNEFLICFIRFRNPCNPVASATRFGPDVFR